MSIYRSCVCLELNKLKSPLKVDPALRRHHRVVIAGVILMAGDCSLGLTGLKTPTLLVPLRHTSFCVKDAASCVCDAVFLSCGRGFKASSTRQRAVCEGNHSVLFSVVYIFSTYELSSPLYPRANLDPWQFFGSLCLLCGVQ